MSEEIHPFKNSQTEKENPIFTMGMGYNSINSGGEGGIAVLEKYLMVVEYSDISLPSAIILPVPYSNQE